MKWEESKGRYASRSLGIWERKQSALCMAGVWEIRAEAAAGLRLASIQSSVGV